MSLGVTKDCFPAATKCVNCERKGTVGVKKASAPKDGYKRCSGCHLLSYCGKDCQREHWIRIHKNHCPYISGKVLVENSTHNATNCVECIDEWQGSLPEIKSKNSARTQCFIEDLAIEMKKVIGNVFGFHKEGKKCDCSLEFGLNLPFSLGEVSGQYVEVGGVGLDAMLAHSLKILNAMYLKASKEQHKKALVNLNADVVSYRAFLWIDLLIHPKPNVRKRKTLSDQVENLQSIYGASNPWWKALKFSIEFILKTNDLLMSTFEDSHSLEDKRFPLSKQLYDYKQSQLRNQAIVCQNQLWTNFMLWPRSVHGSLAVLLPPGTRCQSCDDELSGEMAISPQEKNSNMLPRLMLPVSHNGALMASCPVAKNTNCVEICLSKDVQTRMKADQKKWNNLLEENKLFFVEGRYCDFCFKASHSCHRCAACLSVQYCSPACQKEDSEFHNSVCAAWAQDEARRILGKREQKDNRKSVLDEL